MTQVAAVVGGTVPLTVLAAVHPLMDGPAALAGDLQRLAAAHFLRPADASGAVWTWTQVPPVLPTIVLTAWQHVARRQFAMTVLLGSCYYFTLQKFHDSCCVTV